MYFLRLERKWNEMSFEEIINWENIDVIATIWPRERDSKPRRPFSLNGFQVSNVGIIKINKDNNINILQP